MSFILILLGALIVPAAFGYALKFGSFFFEGIAMFLGGLIFLSLVAAGTVGLLSAVFG